jgi:hypothetical protein
LGYEERGARLLVVCEALLEGIGAVLDPEDRMLYERGVAVARAQLGEEFTRAWAEGPRHEHGRGHRLRPRKGLEGPCEPRSITPGVEVSAKTEHL